MKIITIITNITPDGTFEEVTYPQLQALFDDGYTVVSQVHTVAANSSNFAITYLLNK